MSSICGIAFIGSKQNQSEWSLCHIISFYLSMKYVRCNYKYFIGIIVTLNMVYIYYYDSFKFSQGDKNPMEIKLELYDDRKYIINTPGCRIENLKAYSEDIKDYIYKVPGITCSNKGLLTYVSRTENVVTLNINRSLLSTYSRFKIDCCYSTIKRNPVEPQPDDNLIFSDCVYFHETVIVEEDFVSVECSNFMHKVYENIHSTLQPPRDIVANRNAPNVILVGIDGVSRSNLIRSMPKTFQFCEKNGWVALKGYNKIADNTFPNIMAVLTGMNHSQAANVCDPYDKEKLDSCYNFIWRKFKSQNYSTAYAEDTPSIATFNGAKVGFTSAPTDYYFRPYFLAADRLTPTYLCLKAHCTGPEKTGVRMQNIIKDVIAAVRNATPAFGLFWMNSFSHEDVNCPSSMDDEFVNFLREMHDYGTLDNTIVILFSDHGFRFGKIRQTYTGYMEERLPFIYVWLPKSFRLQHVAEYKNLLDNSARLTTPYDLHMTLQHILHLSNKSYAETPSQACVECHSLLKPINPRRTCGSSGIPQPYCACSRYEEVNKNSRQVQEIADFFIKEINRIIETYGAEATGCSTYFLNSITHAKSLVISEGLEENVLIGIITNPEAIFEATVKVMHGNDSKYTLMETNRLDRYAPKTFCVQNLPVQMYCYCKSVLKHFTNVFCNNKFCFLYESCFNYRPRCTSGFCI